MHTNLEPIHVSSAACEYHTLSLAERCRISNFATGVISSVLCSATSPDLRPIDDLWLCRL
eukprot:454521-Amphidinium_carterae.2